MKILFRCCSLLVVLGCLGSDATNVGSTDVDPLVRVDGTNLPVTISDSTGKSVQVVSGTLTTRSYTISCDYKVDLSDGKSMSGTKTCSLVSDTKVVADDLEFSLDAGDVGGPAGGHSYAFKTDSRKSCSCGTFCTVPCAADRVADSVRSASLGSSSEVPPLEKYKASLPARR